MPKPAKTRRAGRTDTHGILGNALRQSTAVMLHGLAEKAGGRQAGVREQSPDAHQAPQPIHAPHERGTQGTSRNRGLVGNHQGGQSIWGVRAQQRPPLSISEGHLLLVFEEFRTQLLAESPIGYLAIMHWTGQHAQTSAPSAYYVERGRNTARILKTTCQPTPSVLQDARNALTDAKFATTEQGRLTYEVLYWDIMYLCQVHGLSSVPGFGKIPSVRTIVGHLRRIADNFEQVDSSVRQALMCRAPLADCYQQMHRFSEARQEMLTVFALLGRSQQFHDIGQIARESEPELAAAVAAGTKRTAPGGNGHRHRQPA